MQANTFPPSYLQHSYGEGTCGKAQATACAQSLPVSGTCWGVRVCSLGLAGSFPGGFSGHQPRLAVQLVGKRTVLLRQRQERKREMK